ncbi:MAG: GNAT family N-acetyltransferase [Nitrospirae bacterium]|nr:GNAT family N-acetyltransferase [Nitrospirota bacterium]
MLTYKKVETEEEMLEVYNLRFKVYCQERGFEPETSYPDKRMQDEYDAHSIHFIARIGNEAVGTSRVILDNPIGFPIEKYCSITTSIKELKREQTVEVSRVAVSKEIIKSNGYNRRGIILGLIREMSIETRKLGIIYYYAAMTKSLQKLLNKCNITFFQIGPEVDYHGLRAPHFSSLGHVEKGLIINKMALSLVNDVPESSTQFMPHVPAFVG